MAKTAKWASALLLCAGLLQAVASPSAVANSGSQAARTPPVEVPEPDSLLLFLTGAGLIALGWTRLPHRDSK